MPRFSKRAQFIKQLKETCSQRAYCALGRWFFDMDDDDEDLLDLFLYERLRKAQRSRYIFRESTYRKSKDRVEAFDEMMDGNFLNEEEFMREFRVSRASFWLLLDLIKDDPVLKRRGPRGPKPPAPEWQLLVLLRYLGLKGEATSNIRMKNFFRSGGKGSFDNWRDNAMDAILNLRSIAIRWPNRAERRRIAKRFHKKYDWKHCVFIIDGTLFPLRNKPQVEDYADYYGRKLGYTINAVILCDDKRRIRHYLAGNPGSCHDQRAWRQTKVHKRPESYLDPSQYGMGDSAFDPQWFMIPAFSRPRGAPIERPKEVFNDKMKKPRVISEHVNGILKGRFPILTELPHIIKDKETMEECLKCIDCCVILHNLLIGMKDDIPDDWRHNEELSDIDDNESCDENLEEALPADAPPEFRRNQILAYFNDRTI